MAFSSAWNDYGRTRVHVPPMPIFERLSAGTLQMSWTVVLVWNATPEQLAELRNGVAGRVVSGEVSVHHLGGNRLRVTYAGRFSEREVNLDTMAPVWTLIEEKVSRIRTVAGVPRAWYPVFMDQLRSRIDGMQSGNRETLVLLALLRAEPVIATSLAMPSAASGLLETLLREEDSRGAWRYFHGLYVELDRRVAPPERSASALDATELRRLAVQAVAAALVGTTNTAAYALERVLDCMYVLDLESDNPTAARRLAVEDEIQALDVTDLSELGQVDLHALVIRSINAAAELLDYCRSPQGSRVVGADC